MDKTINKEFNTVEELMDYVSKLSKLGKSTYTSNPNKVINKQELALNNVSRGVYIVGSIDAEGNVSFSANPAVHMEATLARAECKRLAQLIPGKAFMFVQLVGAELVPVSRPISY